jgi:outer membrane protein OmpA-like peptidoglycan-associated protein
MARCSTHSFTATDLSHSPATWRVVMLSRFQTFVSPMESVKAACSRSVKWRAASFHTSSGTGSAGFASGCERAGSRSTARLGEAGSIELGGAGEQLARQQATAEQQKADQATRQAEEYRQEREAELAQLQQALGQIAETHRTAMGLTMTLDSKSIRFDFDKANIKPEYRDILNRIAGILMTLKGYSIAVYGYTDDIGTQTYNLQLSQRRAEAVRDFLVQTGISPTTIMSTKGFGKSDPRLPGDSEQARAANRRVEIGIVDSKLITNGPLVVPT